MWINTKKKGINFPFKIFFNNILGKWHSRPKVKGEISAWNKDNGQAKEVRGPIGNINIEMRE